MEQATNVYFSLSSIWGFVLSIVASIGGGAVIVTAVVKYASEKIATRLQAKYQLKLDKDMESYKAEIDKKLEEHRATINTKQYISVKRFDAEFEIYQKLTKAFFEAVRDCGVMIPAGYSFQPSNEEEREKWDEEHYKSAHQSVTNAQDCLHSFAPFIEEELFKDYRDVLMLLGLQLKAYERRFDVLNLYEDRGKFQPEDYKRSREIDLRFDSINQRVREYLNSLDVIG